MARRLVVHLGLLAATAASIFGTNLLTGFRDPFDSAVFTFCVLLILGAHELGHYFMAKSHGVDATWPYFIPLPILSFGTLGAVIRIKGRIPTKNALVDIGAAGPLAGLAIAVPLLVAGVFLSHVEKMPDGFAPTFPGSMSLWNLAGLAGTAARAALDGRELPALQAGGGYFGDNALILALGYLRFGPLPAHHDVVASPVFLAAWFGMLVTMLNLIPVGQLDGGHLTAAWFGPKAVGIGHWLAGALLILALLFSFTWLMFFFLATRVVGFEHPPVVDEAAPMSTGRKVVCVVTLVFGLLTFMPLPLA